MENFVKLSGRRPEEGPAPEIETGEGTKED